MIRLRAPSIEGALAPLGIASATPVDATTLASTAAAVASLPRRSRVAWSMPIVAPGVVAWVVARARRAHPVALEEACEALRHAGVVDVRVTTIDGALPTVLLSGLTAAA